jgi:Skp family chaperone for outer membrane proteins
MKRFLRNIVPALMLVSLMSGSAWGQGRVATVDLRKLFDKYWKTQQADAALKDRAADIEKEHKTMLDEWKKAKEQYQTLLGEANDQTRSLEEREKRKKSAEDKFKQIKDSEDAITQYERQAKSTVDEQRKRMRDSIIEEIRTTVNGKAKAGGYVLVFDTAAESANNTPVVLYSSNENDLTEAVLAQLNAGAPAEALKPDEKKPETKDDKKKDKK